MNTFDLKRQPIIQWMLAFSLLAGLFTISLYNYLLFHTLVELFAVVIAFSIFVMAWNTRSNLDNGYLMFMGISFVSVAVIDTIHTLAYRGMNIFPDITANPATQLWLAARYTQSISLLIAPLFLTRRVRPRAVFTIYMAIVLLTLMSVFYWKIFPTAYVTNIGLTPFKIMSEYVIMIILALSAVLLKQNQKQFDPQVYKLLSGFIVLSILTDLAFTTYVSVYSSSNAFGHIIKVVSYYLLYKAILETGLVRPFNFLFYNLAQREEELRQSHSQLEARVADRTAELRAEILERQKVEQQLQAAKDELELRVTERTAELRQANQQLEQVNRDLERELFIREQVEQALRHSEARLRRLAESNIIGVVFSNINGEVNDANQAYLDMVGYSREDLLNDGMDWSKMTPSQYNEVEARAIQEAYERGACTPFEKEYIRKDGSRVPVLIGFARIDNSDDFTCFVVDLSDRKQSEKALSEYAIKLENSNRELEEFAFAASHDLQEPLRKIQDFGDRLIRKTADHLSPDEADYLQRMVSAAERMRAMIKDLLSLSRITTEAQPFVQVQLAKVVEEVLGDLEVRLERSGGRVEVENLPEIEADPLQMRLLLQNLIGNALKFCKPGVPPVVKVYALPGFDGDQSTVQLMIEDNGIGFEEEFLERIFQPFQRLHGRGRYEGSGVGLAICRKIVLRHGGSLTARSQPGVGSTFIVNLPVTRSELSLAAD